MLYVTALISSLMLSFFIMLERLVILITFKVGQSLAMALFYQD